MAKKFQNLTKDNELQMPLPGGEVILFFESVDFSTNSADRLSMTAFLDGLDANAQFEFFQGNYTDGTTPVGVTEIDTMNPILDANGNSTTIDTIDDFFAMFNTFYGAFGAVKVTSAATTGEISLMVIA